MATVRTLRPTVERMDQRRLLEVRDLAVHFGTEDGVVRAVDGISFDLDRGEVLAVVGESGSGKSVTSLAIMRLIAGPSGRIVSGSMMLRTKDGRIRDLARLPEAEMRQIRGNDVAMIFQEPMTSLNPVFTVGNQVIEAITLHQGRSGREAFELAVETLARLGIPEPRRRMRDYPHQLSGGMRQRVMIAMALSCNPALLIADEPTTALDVTIQAQILGLIKDLQTELEMSVLFITHDLGVVAEIADRVVVMYAGAAVESASVSAIFAEPRMPYTMALLGSIPRLDLAREGEQRLEAVPGSVPSPLRLPPGCRFHPRCRYFVRGLCDAELPPLQDCGKHHLVRCRRWREIGRGAA
jgi:oligopeptide transport system ATP-binding protein